MAQKETDRRQRPAHARPDSKPEDPYIPDHITHLDLHPEVRAQLRPVPKALAERIGKHLVLAGELLDSDPELAYQHAQAAVRRAGRIDVVREAAALTAYACGKYAEALREFRTVRRLSGIDAHRAAEADCERGLGRPERALKVLEEAPAGLPALHRAEMALIEAGARCDLGQYDMALIVVEDAPRTESTVERLDEFRAEILTKLGRDDEAARIRTRFPQPDDSLQDYHDLDARAEYEPKKELDSDHDDDE